MKRKIYLFRHGQTHFNRAKRFTGWKNSNWTTTGMQNARTTAKKLKSKQIDVAFRSKLVRSRHTLQTVLKHHPECKMVFVDDRMIERCYGELQGQTHKAYIKKVGKKQFDIYHRSYNIPPPQGESIKMIEGRVQSFVKDLIAFVKKYKVNVAISAHGNSMRPFRRHFEKASVKQMMKWEMPYDKYFEYTIDVPKGPAPKLTKKSWKEVRLPSHVMRATDKHNTLKKYYKK